MKMTEKHVTFGSIFAVEFHKSEPPTNLRPMDKSEVDLWFSIDEPQTPERTEMDEITRMNSRLLSGWEDFFDGDDDEDVPSRQELK